MTKIILANDDVILLRAGYSIEKEVKETAIEIRVEETALHLIDQRRK